MKLRPWNRSVPFRGTSRDALQEHDLEVGFLAQAMLGRKLEYPGFEVRE